MPRILIFGASGHAKVIIDILEYDDENKIIGMISNQECENSIKYPILGVDNKVPEIINTFTIEKAIIAIGDNSIRYRIFNEIKKGDIFDICAIHPFSVIARDVTIGQGSVIMAGAIINPNSKIGKFCIINTNCSIDHDCTIGDFSSIAPGTAIGGNVSIGYNTGICLGCRIVPQIKIGNNSIIGAGSLVLDDIPDNVLVYGSPAKVIKEI